MKKYVYKVFMGNTKVGNFTNGADASALVNAHRTTILRNALRNKRYGQFRVKVEQL